MQLLFVRHCLMIRKARNRRPILPIVTSSRKPFCYARQVSLGIESRNMANNRRYRWQVVSCASLFGCLFVLVGGLSAVSKTISHAENTRQQLLETYRPFYQRIKDRYDNIHIEASLSGNTIQNRFKRDQIHIRYRASQLSYRIDVMVDGHLSRTNINTPEYRFAVKPHDTETGKFVTDSVNAMSYDQMLAQNRAGLSSLAFAPHCLLNHSVLDYLSSEKTTIQQISHEVADGKRKCRVITEYLIDDEEGQTKLPVSFWLLEDRCWVVEKIVTSLEDTTLMEYGDDWKGVPKIQSVTNWRPNNSSLEKPRMRATVSRMSDLVDGTSIFGGAEFGLPEMKPPNRSIGVGWPFLSLIAALALIVILWIIHRKNRQPTL